MSTALQGTREHLYLKVGQPRQIESWNYMKCGPCSQQQLKLMDGMFVVATETQTPYLEQSFQVQEYCKCNLKQKYHILVSITQTYSLLGSNRLLNCTQTYHIKLHIIPANIFMHMTNFQSQPISKISCNTYKSQPLTFKALQ